MDKSDKIMLTWVDGGHVSSMFMLSVLRAMKKTQYNIHATHNASSVLLSRNRNEVVRHFLHSECDWLLMLDSDIVFDEVTLDTLVKSADKIERPFINGWYHLILNKWEPHAYPDIFVWDESNQRWGALETVPKNKLISVHYTGFGAALMHRNMLNAIVDPEKQAYGWFDEGVMPYSKGEHVGEDFYFCKRAREHGFDVWVNTNAYFRHEKSVILNQQYNYPEMKQGRTVYASNHFYKSVDNSDENEKKLIQLDG